MGRGAWCACGCCSLWSSRPRCCLRWARAVVTGAGPAARAAASPVAGDAAAGVRTEAAFRRAWADPTRRRIELGADLVLRNCRGRRPDPRVAVPARARRQRSLDPPVLLREAAAAPGRHRLPGHPRHHAEPRRLRRPGRGADVARRDLARRLRDHPEPRRGARRRRLLDAAGHRAPLPHQRQPRQRRRRRRSTRAGAGVQVYDSVLSNNLVDGSGGAIGSTGDILVVRSQGRRQHDRRRRRRALRRRGRRRHRHRLAHRRQRRRRSGWCDLHARRRRRRAGLDPQRQPGRRPRRRDLRRGGRARRQLQHRPQPGGRPRRRRDLGARQPRRSSTRRSPRTTRRARAAASCRPGGRRVVSSTITRNIAPVAGDIGSARRLDVFGSIIGPPVYRGRHRRHHPDRPQLPGLRLASRAATTSTPRTRASSRTPTDVLGDDPRLVQIDGHPLGFVLMPDDDSPVRGRIPSGSCRGVLPDPLPAGQLLGGVGRLGRRPGPRHARPPARHRAALRHRRRRSRRSRAGAAPAGRRAGVAAPAVARRRAAAGGGPRRRAPGARSVRRRLAAARQPAAPAAARRPALRPAARLHDVRRRRPGRRPPAPLGLPLRRARRHRHRPRVRRWCARRCAGADAVLLRLVDRAALPERGARPQRHRRRRPGRRLAVDAGCDRLERMRRSGSSGRPDRFDAWESCLSWLPVTEDGDAAPGPRVPDRRGRGATRHVAGRRHRHQRVGRPRLPAARFRADRRRSAMRDRSGRGASTGRARRVAARRRSRIAALREDVEDLVEPVGEITRFDECMYTVGRAAARPATLPRPARRTGPPRRALLRPARPAPARRSSVMATSGEEPPQIECNEDAGLPDDDDERRPALSRSGPGEPLVVVGQADRTQPGRDAQLGQDRAHDVLDLGLRPT